MSMSGKQIPPKGHSLHDVEVGEDRKETVIFICTYNAVRSQIAEGILRARYGDRYQSFSAGIYPAGVDGRAVAVMSEIGIDISEQTSSSIGSFSDRYFDYLVTLCPSAKDVFGYLPRARHILHVDIPDPSRYYGIHGDVLGGYRILRDRTDEWIRATFGGDAKG
jgi:arsenate reductase